mmetsp:Transcript_12401/g.20336  ORF Transcript_12401/g.20336 Transcript_12401/m.20336 type:complete len:465 (-) Transcript_12401:492-1886(-)
MVLYGQIIIGAPGAGKTTYCDGMQQYLRLLGRECYVVNLDPANEVPTDDNNNADENNNGEPADKNASISDADNVESDNSKHDDNNVNTANSQLPYETILDVCQDIISLDAVMKELHLGPNGGLLYCMEYIEHHFGEVLKLLKERLGIADTKGLQHCRAYLLFDLPGQIELTAHSNVITKIAERLVRELDLRLVCVQLVDAAVCLTDVSKFIGASLVCTASMMRLELPCVNLLSKMDLLQDTTLSSNTDGADNKNESDDDDDSDFGYDDYDRSPMPFNLEFFTQCHDLHRLVDYLDSNPMEFMGGQQNDEEYMEDPEYIAAQQKTRTSNFSRKYRKLHQELCEVVEDFGLLSFLPLAIQDAESVGRVVARVDKCNGYVFVRENGGDAKMNQGDGVDNNDKMQDMFSSAMVADSEWATGVLSDVQEKYLGNVMFRENISELKQKDTRKNANVNDDDDDADDLPKLI